MRVFDRTVQRRVAVVGLGVVAVSLFGATAPAVAAAAPTRTVASTSTPSVGVGQAAKLKGVVKPVTGTLRPTGTVTFREGTTVLGTSALALVGTSQTAKLSLTTLAAGSHQIIATYNGSTDFTTSTSLAVTVVVGKSATTTTASSSNVRPVLGQTARVKAVVKQVAGIVQPTGSVTFTEGTTTLGTVALALVGTTQTATLTAPGLALGIHPITATYSGSAGFNISSASITLTVVKGSSASTVTAVPDAATPGKYALVVVVKAVLPATGVPTGVASFVVDGSAPQVLALGATGRAQLSVTFPVGTSHTLNVSYGGDARFLVSEGTLTFTA